MSGIIEKFIGAADAQADVDDEARNRVKAVEILYGSVLEVSGGGRLKLSIEGDTVPGIRMTTACDGVQAGDNVVVTKFGSKLIATGVLSTGNHHYVKELWSNPNGLYMNESQVASLSEPVTEQEHGIVMRWQSYTPGEGVANSRYNYYFVPKTHVGITGGIGLLLFADTRICWKYVYVLDDRITGYKDNDGTKVCNGLTLDNRYQVLTQVLGV